MALAVRFLIPLGYLCGADRKPNVASPHWGDRRGDSVSVANIPVCPAQARMPAPQFSHSACKETKLFFYERSIINRVIKRLPKAKPFPPLAKGD